MAVTALFKALNPEERGITVPSMGPLRAQVPVPSGPTFTQVKTAGVGSGPHPPLSAADALPWWHVLTMTYDSTLGGGNSWCLWELRETMAIPGFSQRVAYPNPDQR